METLLILFGFAGLVLFAAFARHLSLLSAALIILLIGTTFGHSFFNVSFGPIPITIDRVLWGLMLLVLAWFIKSNRAELKPISRVDFLIGVLITLLVVSTLSHDWRYKDNLPLARLLFFNLMPIGFYLCAKHCRVNSKDLRLFFWVFALFGVYLSFTAIAEQRGWYAAVFPRYITDPQYWEFLGRARGPFLNPVSCGIFLCSCLVGVAFLWPKAHPLTRVFIGIVFVLCGFACLLTLTRSVWVGGVIAVGCVLWIPAQAQQKGALLVAGCALLLALVVNFGDRINRFQRDKDVTIEQMAQSATLRPMLARVAFKMAGDKPIFGHGFGQYTAAKKPYHYNQTAGMPLSKVMPYMQHNVFLNYLTETGLIGLALLIALLISFTYHCWQLWISKNLPLEQRQFGLMGLAFVGGFLVNGMFHDISIIPHVMALFYLFLGITENLCSTKQLQIQSLDEPTDLPTQESLKIAA